MKNEGLWFLRVLSFVLGLLLVAIIDEWLGDYESVPGSSIEAEVISSFHRKDGAVELTIKAGEVSLNVSSSDAERLGLSRERFNALQYKQKLPCTPAVSRGRTGIEYGKWLFCT